MVTKGEQANSRMITEVGNPDPAGQLQVGLNGAKE